MNLPTPLLELESVSVSFKGLRAVDKVNISLYPKALAGIIGPNGAGKTTIFNAITGIYRPTEGDIRVLGKSLVGLKPHEVTGEGICRTFQNIRIFKEMTVLENVLVGFHLSADYSIWSAMARTQKFFHREKKLKEEAMELLKLFHMEKKASSLTKNLPYGECRRLEIVRALATHPKLILLDEPAAGLNSQETTELMQTIWYMREKFDLTILLIEHDMKLVMGVCEKITVLDHGIKIAEGTPEEVQKNPKVIEAYLGTAHA